jgi:AraC-like DNA-binding protein
MSAHTEPALLCLWERRTFYLGPLLEPLQLSQSAATLVVSLGSPLDFECNGQRLVSHSALLPAGVRLHLEPHGQTVAVCYLDPFGEDFSRLSEHFERGQNGLLSNARNEELLISRLRSLQQNCSGPEQAAEVLEQLINPLQLAQSEYQTDPRIVRTVELIKSDVSSNLTAEYLAQQAGISVPRLTQLFRENLGIPMRRYRQWHRLFVAAKLVAKGMSLTSASIEAGFTDSSHFCNTFRTIIGMKPTAIFGNPQQIRLFTD